jgi:hypothetical protein
VPSLLAMGPMLKELHARPESGFLGGFTSLYWRGVMVTQYWRSFDHLVSYAQAGEQQHVPAWREFNRRVGSDGTVGIWHETYQVAAGRYECIYRNMPRMGLAAAAEFVPATEWLHDARSRMGAETPQ